MRMFPATQQSEGSRRRDETARPVAHSRADEKMVSMGFQSCERFADNVWVHRAAANDIDFKPRAARGSVCNPLLSDGFRIVSTIIADVPIVLPDVNPS